MSVPPLRKWRPYCDFYRHKGAGWQFCLHPHYNYNPILIVSYWVKEWYLEAHRWSWSSRTGFHTRPKFW